MWVRYNFGGIIGLGATGVNLTRITHERFYCNRRCLTQRDGRDWREKRDWQGQGSHVTRVSLLALVARHSAISGRTVMNNAG